MAILGRREVYFLVPVFISDGLLSVSGHMDRAVFLPVVPASGVLGLQHGQGVGYLSVHLFVGKPSPVDLVEDTAVFDEEHSASPAGGLDAVGHHEDGLAVGVHLGEDAQQPVGGLGVQRSRGLVGQHDLRGGDQCPGHRRALLLAAGDLIGIFLQKFFDAQLPGQRGKPAFHSVVPAARQHQGKEDIVLQGQGVQQIEILEDEA